ncbi:MAG: DeoR/GlpR family DNA-binding transcription regulator [Propionicimonas sp.]|uniref:DeoR/GlpR family DNA-binding transcription regulator n=1 Tax=Propionicimonas sp. TaxID=1955623 RepID=UPI002B1EBFD2|nr:DeoR/GlpR family DNA-binding transcription regulator [Propionicimonas sp.]MEA4944232.1 DeoR/GlpR family DNA-binding transcription regulator [Propionicimonas sp.]MEA5053148.1 DeoR/GlpR family DNA-binding transcription regulator [Propionicimonas sp.]MEA5117324.1 DeoR/GlpR family DNA-binding transcription regulator [Propionicimonas sp.]
MLSATRQAKILDSLRTDGEVTVEELAGQFGVSLSTIRRDLNALSAEGLLRRVRGGGSVEPDKVPFGEVQRQHRPEKKRIAARAAELVHDGDVVLVDIGTTTALLAKQLRGRRITVITASLAVIDELRGDEAVELVVLGGVVRRNYHSMVGVLTEQALAQLHATICFLGTSGIRPDGTITDTTGIEVPVKRAMIASSQTRVVLADSNKFPGVGLLPVCEPGAISCVVTNPDADPATLAALRAAEVEVFLA